MTRRRKIILLINCTALLLGVVLFLARDREPSYQRRPLSEWVIVYHRGWGPQDAHPRSAAQAIDQIGTNAVPYLLRWIQFDYSPDKERWRNTITSLKCWLGAKLDIQESWSLGITDVRLAEAAPTVFELLREHRNLVIPGLTQVLNDPGRPWAANHAAEALARIGEPAIPALKTALEGTNEVVRGVVLRNLARFDTNIWRINPTAASVVPLLIHAMRYGDITNAGAATSLLSRIKPDPTRFIPELVATISSTNDRRAQYATYLLSCYGPLSRSAIPVLTNLATSTNQYTKQAATYALTQIDPVNFTNLPPPIFYSR